MKPLPIIIPFYQAPDELAKCRQHLAASSYSNLDTFIHDNSETNIYFTAAINEGLKKHAFRSDVDYVLILNQNAYVFPDAIANLVAFMDANPDAAIGAPLNLTHDGSRVTWGGSEEVWPSGVHTTLPLDRYVQPVETSWASGSCMMIRTDAIRDVGIFDRTLRFICSDSDFSFSVRARGWKIFVVPSAKIFHEFGGSKKDTSRELNSIKAQDLIRFAEKWMNGDLFKRLAHKGDAMGRVQIKHEIENFRRLVI
jgi:GT2 family glycosyltransferase